jgi:hypothetical protein
VDAAGLNKTVSIPQCGQLMACPNQGIILTTFFVLAIAIALTMMANKAYGA